MLSTFLCLSIFTLALANIKEVKNPFKNGKATTTTTPVPDGVRPVPNGDDDGEIVDPNWRPMLPSFLHGASEETIDAFYEITLDLTISIREKKERVDKLIKTQPKEIQQAYANFESDHKKRLEEAAGGGGGAESDDLRDKLSLSEELKLLEQAAVDNGEAPLKLPLD